MAKWKAHVVVIPFFGFSHSIPMFDFATRLAAAAFKVTILSAEYHVQKVWSDALYRHWAPRLRASGDGIELVAVNDGIFDGSLEGFRTAVASDSSEAKFVAAFGAHLEPLMASAAVPPPCCIVSDMLVWWTQGLAAKFNIPRYVLHIQPAGNLSLILHVPDLVAEGRLPLTEANRTEPIKVPGFRVPVHPADLPSDVKDAEFIAWGAYDAYLRMARTIREAPIVLVNTFRELEADVFAALDDLKHSDHQIPKIIPIGPLLLPDDFPSPGAGAIEDEISEEGTRLMQWLDTQAPLSVLYIAFGTLVENAREQMEEIAIGVEASEQPFLWAAGSPIKRPNKPQPPLVSELLPPGFEERTRERGKIATGVVPQLRILQHPACGAFLNHCGWNSVLEGISGGVPLIAWPRQFEQWMTARHLIDSAQVAAELVEVRRGFVAGDEIERVVRLVMQQAEGEELRSRAEELQQLAARLAYSNSNLDAFLAGITRMDSRTPGA